jgi:predicted nucleic acid-binding protein
MTVNLTVQAEVIDLQGDLPRIDDLFLVDTNVWFWLTYANAGYARGADPNKIGAYSNYLSFALSNGATLTYSGLILAELTHIIEKNEREIYIQTHGFLPSKEYRHNLPQERNKVVAEVQAAWSQVEAFAVPTNLTINDQTIQAALARYQSQAVDGYDLLLLEAASREGLTKFITDDKDYATVPGIQVFTLDAVTLQAARNQGKLVTR